MSQNHQDIIKPHARNGLPAWLDVIQEKVGSLRFGVVQIIVHDSEVVQIERTERIRFDNTRPDKTKRRDSGEGEP